MEMTRRERRAGLGEQSGSSLVSITRMRHTRTTFLLERGICQEERFKIKIEVD